MREFRGDLHIHTCLSPCGDLSMLPIEIVRKAKEKGLDIIGICDHNSAENVTAVRKAGEREEISVIGGIEITSEEEVHILALFDSDDTLSIIQNIIYDHLPGENDEETFGYQVVVDEKDEIKGINRRLLIGATTLLIDRIVDIIHRFKGIAIAAHIDRDSFSIISQLGFIPEGLAFDALEVSPFHTAEDMRRKFPSVNNFPIITSSDAHYLEDIGKARTSFLMEEPSVEELSKAFRGIGGRKILGM